MRLTENIDVRVPHIGRDADFLQALEHGIVELAIGLNLCVGIRTVVANKRYFEELDDLQRKVHLNSLAITVGVAMIVGVPYSVMASYRLIPFHADASHLVVIMALTYGASNLYGTWRYR